MPPPYVLVSAVDAEQPESIHKARKRLSTMQLLNQLGREWPSAPGLDEIRKEGKKRTPLRLFLVTARTKNNLYMPNKKKERKIPQHEQKGNKKISSLTPIIWPLDESNSCPLNPLKAAGLLPRLFNFFSFTRFFGNLEFQRVSSHTAGPFLLVNLDRIRLETGRLVGVYKPRKGRWGL